MVKIWVQVGGMSPQKIAKNYAYLLCAFFSISSFAFSFAKKQKKERKNACKGENSDQRSENSLRVQVEDLKIRPLGENWIP